MSIASGHIVSRLRQAVDNRRAVLLSGPPLIDLASRFANAVALEPGGPSSLFGPSGLVPVYPHLAALDILDHRETTLWSTSASPEIEQRRRLIGEAGSLETIEDASYDVVLASHVIEHLANPLGALAEWARVLRPDGQILLVVPHKDGTFDRLRPPTSVDHLQRDAEERMGEDDLTHLDEILELHDLSRDPGVPDRAAFEQRCRENHRWRAMHHHVFVSRTVIDMCHAAGLAVRDLHVRRPFHIICVCGVGQVDSGIVAKEAWNETLQRSPFASDRAPT